MRRACQRLLASATRWAELAARQWCCAESMSLNAIAIPAASEPVPLVTRCRSRTVAKVDPIGLVVWTCSYDSGSSSLWMTSTEGRVAVQLASQTTPRYSITACQLAQSFALMVRERRAQGLQPWLSQADTSGTAAFRMLAAGLWRNEAAVRAALKLPWSRGQVVGQIRRLKLIKRAGYGRASFGLLRRRVVAAA